MIDRLAEEDVLVRVITLAECAQKAKAGFENIVAQLGGLRTRIDA